MRACLESSQLHSKVLHLRGMPCQQLRRGPACCAPPSAHRLQPLFQCLATASSTPQHLYRRAGAMLSWQLLAVRQPHPGLFVCLSVMCDKHAIAKSCNRIKI